MLNLLNSSSVVKVTAYLDNSVYSLSSTDGIKWHVDVPPDLEDGQYDTLIIGENAIGEQGAWSGILYMLTGKACLKNVTKKLELTKQDKEMILRCQQNKIELNLVEKNYFLNLISGNLKLEFIRGCCV